MKAVRFAAPIPTYLLTRLAGRLSTGLLIGPHACTRFGEIEEPALPGPRWLKLRTLRGGICGSDLNVIALEASPQTSPFSSFPFVFGHEIVGVVIETGQEVRSFAPGDRVGVNPLLSCIPRGIEPPCAACAVGSPSRCAHFADGAIPPGLLVGTTRSLGGGWGERVVVHETQAVRLPAELGDDAAVLAEPLACSVHAVRGRLPSPGERVLVIGAGSIGLLTLAALRALAPGSPVTVVARHSFQAEHAERLGAAGIVLARGEYTESLAEAAGARLLRPILGRQVAVGGFDACYLCAGGTRAVDDALRFTRAGGEVVVLGNVTLLPGMDWTPLWFKELTLRGSLCYGRHGHGGAHRDAFEEAVELIAGGRAPVGALLTHTFPLAEYRQAIATAMDKRGNGSIKVAFRY